MSLSSIFQKLIALYFIVGMHIILDTPGGTGLYLSFNVIGWIFAVLFIAIGFWQITLNQKIYYSKFHLYALSGFVLLCVPMFYPNDLSDLAIPRILGLAGGLLFMFVLPQIYYAQSLLPKRLQNHSVPRLKIKSYVSKKVNAQLLIWIVYATALEAAFGLIQVFVLETGDWGGYKPGISRPHGVFLQTNVMASFMVTGLALCWYLSVNIRYLTFKRFNKSLINFTLFSSCFLLVLLQSRSGHLSALIVLLLLGTYVYTQHKAQFKRNLLCVLLGALAALMILITNDGDLKERTSENYQTPGARPNTYLVTTEMIKNNPLTGVGYGLYERGFLDEYNAYVIKHPEIGAVQHRMAHPHNESLLWVSEGGIAALFGLMVFIAGYFVLWRKIVSPNTRLNIDKNKKNNIIKAFAVMGVITPLLLHSQLEFPFYISLSHWLVFLIILWFTELHSRSPFYTINYGRTFLLRSLAVITCVIFIPFFVTTLHTGHIIVAHEKSGKYDISSFQEIINPVAWQRRLDKHVYAYILLEGLKNKKPKALKLYITWGMKRIRFKPSANVYSNTLLAMKVLGKKEEYRKLLQEAQNTYPLYDEWGQNFLEHKQK